MVAEAGKTEFVNWNTRLLGRDGVMKVILMADSDKIDEILPKYSGLIAGYSFAPGKRYAEFKQGDKIAAFGLGALVLGGGLGLAAKGGLLKGFMKLGAGAIKLVLVGVAVVIGVFAKLFGGGTKG